MEKNTTIQKSIAVPAERIIELKIITKLDERNQILSFAL